MIGKQCLIRTLNTGVHFGELIKKVGDEVTLINSRRIWAWIGAATLSQIASEGIKNIKKSKITMPEKKIILLGVTEIIELDDKAIANLKRHPEWKF